MVLKRWTRHPSLVDTHKKCSRQCGTCCKAGLEAAVPSPYLESRWRPGTQTLCLMGVVVRQGMGANTHHASPAHEAVEEWKAQSGPHLTNTRFRARLRGSRR